MEVKFDQHFLINEEILNKIIEAINVLDNESILEIGGGKGILTSKIIKQNPKLFTCVEIDSEMITHLQQLFNNSNHTLIHQSATEFLSTLKQNEFDKIVGNIPYGITESIYTQLYFLQPKECVFLQSHKTTRTLIEKQDTKQAQIINALYNLDCVEIVEGDNFKPIAKTKSSIIKLTLKEEFLKTQFEHFLTQISKRYNQTFFNSCVFSLAKVLEVGKKEIKSKLKELNIDISKEKISQISNEEFNVTIKKIEETFLN